MVEEDLIEEDLIIKLFNFSVSCLMLKIRIKKKRIQYFKRNIYIEVPDVFLSKTPSLN